MKFTSTRSTLSVDSLPAILRGLAPDGGLFVPASPLPRPDGSAATLADAERIALDAFFDDVPESVREDAIRNLLSKFPANDPTPLVDADGFKILELFHGPTGAFKDVALSVLPVLMTAAAQGRRVLILTATSGDTGSAAMAGFADVPGVEIAVFFPHTGTSRIQRLQMTTPAAKNVHGIAIRGNFDDAQAAVKRIFSDPAIRAAAESAGILLSSANSINIGRLVPQVAYYLHAAAKVGQEFDVVVPSGNFGNILAAYYAKLLGAPIRTFVCASNVNDVLTRFIATGTYDPGGREEAHGRLRRHGPLLALHRRHRKAPNRFRRRVRDARGDRGRDAPHARAVRLRPRSPHRRRHGGRPQARLSEGRIPLRRSRHGHAVQVPGDMPPRLRHGRSHEPAARLRRVGEGPRHADAGGRRRRHRRRRPRPLLIIDHHSRGSVALPRDRMASRGP